MDLQELTATRTNASVCLKRYAHPISALRMAGTLAVWGAGMVLGLEA